MSTLNEKLHENNFVSLRSSLVSETKSAASWGFVQRGVSSKNLENVSKKWAAFSQFYGFGFQWDDTGK